MRFSFVISWVLFRGCIFRIFVVYVFTPHSISTEAGAYFRKFTFSHHIAYPLVMAGLPKFDRVHIVMSPLGDLIASGQKTALVKSQCFHMEHEVILIVQERRAIGTITIAAPQAISLAAFRQQHGRHRMSELERCRRWPRHSAFFMYDILEFHPLARTVSVNCPRTPRTFISPKELTLPPIE